MVKSYEFSYVIFKQICNHFRNTPQHLWYVINTTLLQMQDGIGGSVLTFYRKAAKLRRKNAFQNSNIKFTFYNEDIFSFLRFDKGDPETLYLIVANIGASESTNDFIINFNHNVYTKGIVILSNVFNHDSIIELHVICLDVGQVVVLRLIKTYTFIKSEL